MNIQLSPEIEHYLQVKVSTGFYHNAAEVIRDAIRRMKEEDGRLSLLKEAVRVGDEQIDRGEGIIYSQERLDAISEKALANARNGKQVNPYVSG
jgi:antitoxin ParD1/3/4